MIQFNSNGTTLSKHEALQTAKTNGRNVLFHLLLLSNVHFFALLLLLSSVFGSLSLFRFDPFRPHLGGLFLNLFPTKKTKQQNSASNH